MRAYSPLLVDVPPDDQPRRMRAPESERLDIRPLESLILTLGFSRFVTAPL